MKISVIICTYNRASLLKHCLTSLTKQTAPESDFEVLVVDNNSTDNTAQISHEFVQENTNFRHIIEHTQGLSYARNRGYKEVKSEWVLYLDDDAKATENLISQAIWVIENSDYKFFGGLFIPWYHYGKPYWYKEKYGSNRMKYKTLTNLKNGEYVSGGIMVCKKELLESFNGFAVNLGMIGNKVGYGEETDLQIRIRKKGIAIGYDPDLVIAHLVAKYKLDVAWFFKSYFNLGRDQLEMGIFKGNIFSVLLTSITLVAMLILHFLWYTPKLLSPNYFIQNWMLDVFKKPTKRLGVLYTALIQKSKIKNKSGDHKIA